MTQHIPVVRIVTPEPDRHGITPAVLSRLTVDGLEWPVVDYAVKGHVDGIQQVTLTFIADVTITHPESA